ncbi:hypothetical protein M433DRAFT_8153 [Acidomyces richmondensis BFW]|nr:hypothetical protein M433DRAFT_8153 [Acidomyces richmondensis BFW]
MFRRVVATAPARASLSLKSVACPYTTSFARTVTPYSQSNSRRSYHEKVLDHYNNPRNVGSLGKNDKDVGTGLVGAPACGDVMKIQIKVDPKDERITDVKFKTFGCGSAIASSSYLTELVKGMTLEQAGRIRNTEIAKELCLPPVKLHCSMLAEDGIKSAIQNYYKKNPKAAATDLGGTGASMPKIEVEKLPADMPSSTTA